MPTFFPTLLLTPTSSFAAPAGTLQQQLTAGAFPTTPSRTAANAAVTHHLSQLLTNPASLFPSVPIGPSIR